METAILLFQCKDKKGIIAKISSFLAKKDANIISADQHSTDPAGGHFFIRIEFYFDNNKHKKENFEKEFSQKTASIFKAKWKIFYKSQKMKMGLLVSKPGHCLFDILYRHKTGQFNVEIPFIISNHPDHKELAEQFGIPYHYIKTTKQDKKEKEILNIISNKTDFLVLARYMQILSPGFIKKYKNDIINIHHSFLPGFKGANPYKQAFDKGVKIIGASAHYVTADLDEGPIIEQMVEPISHKDSMCFLKEKGKNLEKIALSNAICSYLNHRIIKFQGKTIVF